MTGLSYYDSRQGKISCNAEELFAFVTDIRNFKRFIPGDIISNWNSDKETCSFSVSMLGTVSLRISEKVEFSKVVFTGDALKKNDFCLSLEICDNMKNPVNVRLLLYADFNPMIKMVAAKAVGQFLEMIIKEMERIEDWSDIKV